MAKSFTELIMNPVRLRILQYLMPHELGTVNEIRQELSDIPPASLYRHMNVLLEAGLIEIAAEKKIRGTIEKTYRLSKQPPGSPEDIDYSMLFQSGLAALPTAFLQYFSKEDADPKRDLLFLSTSTLMLDDGEFEALLNRIGSLLEEVLSNQPGKGRKPRRITILSSPCEEES